MTDIWLMLMLLPLVVTPGVTHFGAYHRPPGGHFNLTVLPTGKSGEGKNGSIYDDDDDD